MSRSLMPAEREIPGIIVRRQNVALPSETRGAVRHQ